MLITKNIFQRHCNIAFTEKFWTDSNFLHLKILNHHNTSYAGLETSSLCKYFENKRREFDNPSYINMV